MQAIRQETIVISEPFLRQATTQVRQTRLDPNLAQIVFPILESNAPTLNHALEKVVENVL